MPINLLVKDFLWWLIKENRLVNLAYLKLGKRLFSPLEQHKNNAHIPLTSKPDYLTAKPKCWPFIRGYSSGTTNQPLTVFRSIKSILLEEYVLKSALHTFGIPTRPSIAVLRGDHISASDDQSQFFLKLPFTGRLLMSSYHLGPATAQQYLDRLEAHQPDVIMAYPSSIYLLAQLADKMNWKPGWTIRCIFTSSETFSKDKQQLVRKIFGPVCDHYGQAERVAALQTCPENNYHVREDYSLVEFIQDEHGLKIVGTNQHNKAMPMQRYDTGDYAKGLSITEPCPCGNPSVWVEEIVGRDDDYVLLPDGRQIGRLDVVFKGIEGLVEAQLEQTKLNHLIIRYVPYPDIDHKILILDIDNSLRQRLGQAIQFEFVPMEQLPRTERGKFKSVVRSLNLD